MHTGHGKEHIFIQKCCDGRPIFSERGRSQDLRTVLAEILGVHPGHLGQQEDGEPEEVL